MVTGGSNLVEIDGIFRGETEKAWRVDFGLKEPTWLPKSLVELNFENYKQVSITLPDWLAVEKGLDILVKS